MDELEERDNLFLFLNCGRRENEGLNNNKKKIFLRHQQQLREKVEGYTFFEGVHQRQRDVASK